MENLKIVFYTNVETQSSQPFQISTQNFGFPSFSWTVSYGFANIQWIMVGEEGLDLK